METRRAFIRKASFAGITGILSSGTTPAFSKEFLNKKRISINEVKEIHKKFLIIDGHNDTPVERIARKENPVNWLNTDYSYHTDIPRMKSNGQRYVAFMIVGNGPNSNVWTTIERIKQQLEINPDDITEVLNSKDALRAGKENKVGVILSIEGAGNWLEGRIELLHIFHRLGIRLVGISHGEGGNESSMLQGTPSLYRLCTADERRDNYKNSSGLTSFGIEVLKTQNELGIITDLSHINDRAFFDVIEKSSLPPIMSHTAVFSLCQHSRCMTDDQIRSLAQKGGVMGIAFAPQFIDLEPGKATINKVVEHILYVADLVGMDYVGIGTDYDGLGTTVPVIPEISQLFLLTQSMLEHGLTENDIKKVWGGNFLRVIRQVTDKNRIS